ncbi:MAG: hypothetical protein NVS2B3_02260 [Vulcanimicrobiaceae bacterium]
MRVEFGRDAAATLDPAIVAAIGVALTSLETADGRASASAPGGHPARSPWRAAGRSVEAFDAYDAARYALGARARDGRAPR